MTHEQSDRADRGEWIAVLAVTLGTLVIGAGVGLGWRWIVHHYPELATQVGLLLLAALLASGLLFLLRSAVREVPTDGSITSGLTRSEREAMARFINGGRQ